jgi:hypothetical protein
VDVDLSLGTMADCFTSLRRQPSRGNFVIPQPHSAIPLNRHYHRIFSVRSRHRYGVNNFAESVTFLGKSERSFTATMNMHSKTT